MKLNRIEITNFRCFESLSVHLRPEINVFVGVNGAGKSTILDAVAIALFDIVAANGAIRKGQRTRQGTALRPSDIYIAPDEGVGSRREFVQVRAQARDFYSLPNFPNKTDIGKERYIEWTDVMQYRPPNDFIYDTSRSERLSDIYNYFESLWREISYSDPDALIPLPVVAYYRAGRRMMQMPAMGDIFALRLERNGALRDALDCGVDYQAMFQWYYLRENQELRERLHRRNDLDFEFPDLRAVRRAITTTLVDVERIYFEDIPPRLRIQLHVTDDKQYTFDLEQLSDGYRNLLALVMDFSRRLAQANPKWENPLDAPGILLVDEIELHLHPQWQQQIIPTLSSLFPNTQLIIATHSPQVLTTVKRENIFILKDHHLHQASISTYGADSKRVTREVLETESRPPGNDVTDKIQQLFALIGHDQLVDAADLCDALMDELGADEPALLEAQTIIKNRQWEKELGL